jgi:arylsulfatase A-like enzyme
MTRFQSPTLRLLGLANQIAICLFCGVHRAAAEAPAEPAHPLRPNVLMIVVDDMNDWIGCLGGHPNVQTPNLDRLARRGLLFTNAHCPAPVCNPSRAAVLTGRAPHRTGIYDNAAVWHRELPGVVSLPSHFRTHGYHVLGGGKVYHHTPDFNRRSDWDDYFDQVFDSHAQRNLVRGSATPFRWPEGFPLNGLPEVAALENPPKNAREFDWGPFDVADAEMGDGRLVTWAEGVLREPPAEPFFLAAGIYRPHLPWYAPRSYFDRYPPESIVEPPVLAGDVDDLPPGGQRMAADRRGDLEIVRREGRYAEILQAYLANITFADTLVGRLLDALDAGPARDRTIVVLWSDHGWHFGEKEHLHKFTLWERSTRVPFMIAAPGTKPAGLATPRPVGLIDLFPTLVDLCGLPLPADLDGRSLVPLLENPETAWDHPVLITHGRGNHALRTERWRYIRYDDGGEELYDHAGDPHEWTNLAGRPEHAGRLQDFARLLPASDAPARRAKAGKKWDRRREAEATRKEGTSP